MKKAIAAALLAPVAGAVVAAVTDLDCLTDDDKPKGAIHIRLDFEQGKAQVNGGLDASLTADAATVTLLKAYKDGTSYTVTVDRVTLRGTSMLTSLDSDTIVRKYKCSVISGTPKF